jgi:hypothetical protein
MMSLHRPVRVLPVFFALTALAALGCSADRGGDAAASLEAHFPDTAARVLAGARPIIARERGFGLASAEESEIGTGVHPTWPARGEDAVRLELSGGFTIDIHETGLVGAAQPGDRAVAYPRDGGASFWGAATDGVEEWLHLGPGVAFADRAAAVFQVDGGTLRQNGDRVEILDDADEVRMEVSAPEAFAAGGARIPVTLAVRGDSIELTVDAEGAAVLVDPIWTATGSMATARYGHAALRLASGDVLVVGGYNGAGFVGTAERYLAGPHAWTASGALATGRQNPSLVQLPNARVMVLCGIGPSGYLATTEIYTPSTNAWTPGPSMGSAHYVGTASPTLNSKILVAGGVNGPFLNTAELYDPATNTWSAAASMAEARWAHAAVTLVPSGKILVVGGQNANGFVSSAEVWDPTTNSWSAAGSLAVARRGHRASLMPDGKVLVVGGENQTGSLNSVEIWNPTTNSWTVAAPMRVPRYFPTIIRSGNALLVAGGRTMDNYTQTTELFDLTTQTWSLGSPMGTRRYFHTATGLLAGGGILVAGGWSGVAVQASAELYQ